MDADPTGRTVLGRGSVDARWYCGLESRRWYGCVFLVSVMCCREISVSG